LISTRGAKFLVAEVWCLLLAAQVYLLGLLIGAGLGLPGWSTGTAGHGLRVVALTAVMAVALVAPFALVASIGRGYMAVGVMLAAVFVAQIVAALDYGQVLPLVGTGPVRRHRRPRPAHPGPVGIRRRGGRCRGNRVVVAHRRPYHLTTGRLHAAPGWTPPGPEPQLRSASMIGQSWCLVPH
jgi:hypothetical protein